MSAQQVRIVNPIQNGSPTTSLERARGFVLAGRADFVDAFVIRFRDTALNKFVTAAAQDRLNEQNTGYDRTRRSFFQSRTGLNGRRVNVIPVIAPEKMVREERSSREWSFTASVFLGGHRRPFAGSTARVHTPSASQVRS